MLNVNACKSPDVNSYKRSSWTVRVPSDLLEIISEDGEPLDIEKSTIQFRVRLMKGDATTGSIRPELLHFNARLQLFNADENELIPNNEYEIECTNRYILTAAKQETPWTHANSIDERTRTSFSDPPILTVNFKWSSDIDFNQINRENSKSEFKSKLRPRSKSAFSSQKKLPKKAEMYIMYKFINRNYYKETCYHLNFGCPWCESTSNNLYILIKHLTVCHDLFTFKYVGTFKKEIRIHVYINHLPPAQSEEKILFIPSERGTHRRKWEPRRRQTFTKIIAYYPKHMRSSMFEYLFIRRSGFYHATTGLPVHRKEMYFDSDEETDPKWLRDDTVRMIDDFSDLNSGEKTIMELWNLHVLKHLHLQGKQLVPILFTFIETHGEFIIVNRLHRNFILHLVTLFDFKLLASSEFMAVIQMLYNFIDDKPDIKAKLFEYVQDDRGSFSAANSSVLNGQKLKAKDPILSTPKQPQSACSTSQPIQKQSETMHSWKSKADTSKGKTPKPSSRVLLRAKSFSAPRPRQRLQKPSEVMPSRKRKSAAASPEMPLKPSSRMLLRAKSFCAPRPQEDQQRLEFSPPQNRNLALEHREIVKSPKKPTSSMRMRLRSQSFYGSRP